MGVPAHFSNIYPQTASLMHIFARLGPLNVTCDQAIFFFCGQKKNRLIAGYFKWYFFTSHFWPGVFHFAGTPHVLLS